jgi:hypothetical protein
VESDEPQVTVNQRYEVYFPEKRPFFMENAGYFKTPEMLFFSRRIGEPRFGARFTGKTGKWALGALLTDDRAPGQIVREDNPLHGRVAGDAVIRLQRELKGNSNVAVMVTNRDFGSTYNRVFSVDTRLHLLRNWILSGQAMTSRSQLEDKLDLAGPAYYLNWAHNGKNFISETTYTDRSPDFRAALGYFERVDIREARQTLGYMWRPEGRSLVSFGPLVRGMINYDRQGRLQDWLVNPHFVLRLTRMTEIVVERRQAYELYGNQGFRKYDNEVSFKSEWLKWLAFDAMFTRGTSVNYYPAEGFAPFLGRMTRMSAGFTLRPTPHAKIEESYIYSGLRTDEDSGLEAGLNDASIFNNHIFRSKVNYQFNRQYSLRVIVDYNSVLPNSTLVDLEKTKHVGIDALFTYLLNPGTALHVGYTDLYDNLRYNPTMSPNLWRTQFPNLNTGRQAFVKLSYLFRF